MNDVDCVAEVVGWLGKVCCPRESAGSMRTSLVALFIGPMLSSVVCLDGLAGDCIISGIMAQGLVGVSGFVGNSRGIVQ